MFSNHMQYLNLKKLYNNIKIVTPDIMYDWTQSCMYNYYNTDLLIHYWLLDEISQQVNAQGDSVIHAVMS